MLEILKFVFSSFWIWLGTVILICSVAGGIAGLFRAIIHRNKDDK